MKPGDRVVVTSPYYFGKGVIVAINEAGVLVHTDNDFRMWYDLEEVTVDTGKEVEE